MMKSNACIGTLNDSIHWIKSNAGVKLNNKDVLDILYLAEFTHFTTCYHIFTNGNYELIDDAVVNVEAKLLLENNFRFTYDQYGHLSIASTEMLKYGLENYKNITDYKMPYKDWIPNYDDDPEKYDKIIEENISISNIAWLQFE